MIKLYLQDFMKENGGFEHNAQALRLVDVLESPYLDHPGLNLMFETREGLLKHCSLTMAQNLGDVAYRHLHQIRPTVEAQVVDWCDAIAYLHGDLEDAFHVGLLSPSLLLKAPGFQEAWVRVLNRLPHKIDYPSDESVVLGHSGSEPNRAIIKTVIREMFSQAAKDLTLGSWKLIHRFQPKSSEEARHLPELVGFEPEVLTQHIRLKKWSRKEIYEHPRVNMIRQYQAEYIRFLCDTFLAHPDWMICPTRVPEHEHDLPRLVCDHVASMTDRSAYREVCRLEQKLASQSVKKRHP